MSRRTACACDCITSQLLSTCPNQPGIGNTGLQNTLTHANTAQLPVECIATCELDLSALWDAAAGGAAGADLFSTRLALAPTPDRGDSYAAGGAVGWVSLTLVGARAVAALRRAAGG